MEMSMAKETITSVSNLDQNASVGVGGNAYMEQVFKLLFKTHYPGVVNEDGSENAKIKDKVKRLHSLRVSNQLGIMKKISDDVLKEKVGGIVNCWTVGKRPRDLSNSKDEVYRVVEKPGRLDAGNSDDIKQPEFPDISDFSKGVPEILVISDHARSIRDDPRWAEEYSTWLKPSNSGNQCQKIILLGNRLPAQVLGKSAAEKRKEKLWEVLFSDKSAMESTIIVTSIDRLRQEGAKISQRISWDATLLDFQSELEKFEPLKKLAKFGNLIVRVGVVGAIHCYWVKTKSGSILESKFVYDPNAEQQIYRDRNLQGNAFGIRTALPACIAFHLMLRKRKEEPENMPYYDNCRHGPILRGIRDSISMAQMLYRQGFGDKLEDVTAYIVSPELRMKKMEECMRKSKQSQFEKVNSAVSKKGSRKGRPQDAEWFAHIVRLPDRKEVAKKTPAYFKWEIIRDNLSTNIKRRELLRETLKLGKSPYGFARKLLALEELRRLRMARAIAFFGLDASINNAAPHKKVLRNAGGCDGGEMGLYKNRCDYLNEQLKSERKKDSDFRVRNTGEVAEQEIVLARILLPDNLFSLCGPIARYGNLKVLGKEDSETYNSIRNLLSLHLASGAKKPLSIAVFGSPGCGKSFGVKSLALSMAKDRIEVCTFNISQLEGREDLDGIFFSIAEVLLRGKIPLVFFDEFDSELDGKLGWIKYFLGPMQDGLYKHNHGVIELKNSIFVFAGGTKEDYEDFCEFDGGGMEHVEAKKVKLPDFVSRLHGHINIASLNPTENNPKFVPFVRRALILRSMIERDNNLVDRNGVAQIDRNLMDALLRVKKYEYGARSIEAVLRMCVRWNHRIEKSSVPEKSQLAMHTDADDFISLVTDPEGKSNDPYIRRGINI